MAAVMSDIIDDSGRRKSMNHMDPETKIVHARLEEWAKWAKDSGIAGYPRQSLTEKAAQYGKLGIPQESNYRSESMMPDHVAVIDAAICRLGDVDRSVVKMYYLRWEAVAVMAWKLRMRERKFQHILQRARWRIMGYLDAAN
jgi:hypothetical protein